MGFGRTGSDDGPQAVKRRLPARAEEIDRLSSDARFRAICDDLAEVERALEGLGQMAEPARSDRRAECFELIGELVEEVVRELDRAKVVPHQGGQGHEF
jgi:hypothetical protein